MGHGQTRASVEIVCPDCGSIIRHPKRRGKPRSVPQHRRLFGLVRAAFNQWPDSYEFQPRDEEHLRFWLLKEVGHCEVAKTIRCETVNVKALTSLLTSIFRAADSRRCFLDVHGDLIHVIVPHSVSFEKLPHSSACVIYSLIEDRISQVIGVQADTLLKAKAA